jgi:hypothetical protein
VANGKWGLGVCNINENNNISSGLVYCIGVALMSGRVMRGETAVVLWCDREAVAGSCCA